MKRNPPSKGFNFIGEGVNAKVFKKDAQIEIICHPQFNLERNSCVHSLNVAADVQYDLSRELMIKARELASPSARKHLPVIFRDRIDLNEDGIPEIVYSSIEYGNRISPQNDRYLVIIQCGLWHLDGRLPDPLREACEIIGSISEDHLPISDMGDDNFSQSKQGDLIIRDPFVLIQNGYGSVSLQDLWPEREFAKFDDAIKHYRTHFTLLKNCIW
jgi:hypothetical protein